MKKGTSEGSRFGNQRSLIVREGFGVMVLRAFMKKRGNCGSFRNQTEHATEQRIK